MNNLLLIFSVLTIIGISTTMLIYGFVSAFQWVEEDDDTYAKNYKLWAIFVIVFGMSFVGIQVASKNLAQLECGLNNGTFTTWDNGFSWECYNPDMIQQDNNSRIILSEDSGNF